MPEVLCVAIAQHHDVAPEGGPLAVALRAGVLVASGEPEDLAQLDRLTDGRIDERQGARLALSAAAGAAALSASLA